MIKRFLNGLFLCALLFPALLFALENSETGVTHSNNDSSNVDNSSVSNSSIEARRWGLTVKEWNRYEEIMKGEGRFNWTKADPITVLGVYAKTDAERDRYAERLAIQEYNIQKKFLALNNAYMRAFRRLYSDVPVMDMDKFNSFYGTTPSAMIDGAGNTINSGNSRLGSNLGNRFVLFISTNCSGCNTAYRKLSNAISFGTSLDVYIVGANNDDELVTWAKNMSIDPSLVKQKTITLNHDNGMYARYGRPPLPAAFYYNKSDGNVQPVSNQDIH